MPLSEEGDDTAFVWRQVHHALFIAICRTAAVGLGIPTCKGVTGFGITIGGQINRCVIDHGLIGCAAAVGGVAVEPDGIMVGSPLGKQGDGFSFDRCQITDILSIGIASSAAIVLSVPAGKGIARFGIAVGCQVCRLIVDHGLVGSTATISSVPIEYNGVVIRPPLGEQDNRPSLF